MKKPVKIALWGICIVVAVPTILFLVAFFAGFFNALFGDQKVEPSPNPDIEAEQPLSSPPPENENTLNSSIIETNMATAMTTPSIKLPENITAKNALRWVAENGLITLRDGIIYVEFETFKRLSMQDALTLHRMFSKAYRDEDVKHSTPETEALKRQHNMMRLYVFTGASVLPPKERHEFAKKAGAVFPPSAFHNGMHFGDYPKLFTWHGYEKSGSAEVAIRNYAEVFSDKEMIGALFDIKALEVIKRNPYSNANERWRVTVGEKLAQLEPETLQTIHNAIKKTIGGDRVIIRRDLRKLIESHHTADSLKPED